MFVLPLCALGFVYNGAKATVTSLPDGFIENSLYYSL